MNRLPAILLAMLLVLAACERAEEQPPDAGAVTYLSFGEDIPEDHPALAPADLAADPSVFHGQDVRVAGTIVEVCQRRGCWLTFAGHAGEAVTIHVPRDAAGEYLWTVPLDLGRRHAIVEGEASVDTLSVERLRQRAAGAGRPPDEVEAITQPQLVSRIRARGILVEAPAAPATELDAAAPPDAPDAASPERRAEPARRT